MEQQLERELKLLQIIKSSTTPLGANYLSEELEIPIATVGRMLAKLEREKKLEKIANRGRQLTGEGKKYLSSRLKRRDKLKTASNLIQLVEDKSKERLLEILQVRKLIEVKAVELTTLLAKTKDINTLEEILLDYTYEVKHGMSDSESDMRLHLSIAQMSGNATIAHVLKLLLVADNNYTLITAAAGQTHEERLKEHLDIVKGIKSRNAKRATGAMSAHLDSLINHINQLS